jgi:NAD-specific glutamate dehydrogenase
MANTKTQRISFGNDSSSSTIKQQTVKIEREIAQEQVAPLKQLTAQIIKEAKDTRSIAKVNPYTSFFPSFYKREISIARLTFIF